MLKYKLRHQASTRSKHGDAYVLKGGRQGEREHGELRDRSGREKKVRVSHVSMGISSSEVVSSERGISSTSSSEEEQEKEGDAERGREVGDGEDLKREMLRPSEWKRDAREGLLGGIVMMDAVCCVSGSSIGWTENGGGGEGGGGASACSCVSVCWDKHSF